MGNLTTSQLEDDLFIRSWGLYVAPMRMYRDLGYKPQSWQKLYQPRWRDKSPNPPPIDPDREDQTERMVSQLPKEMQEILAGLYAWRFGVNELARELGKSRQEVARTRDTALSILWGRLCFRDTG